MREKQKEIREEYYNQHEVRKSKKSPFQGMYILVFASTVWKQDVRLFILDQYVSYPFLKMPVSNVC